MKTNESGRIGFISMLIMMFLAVLVVVAAMYIVPPIMQGKEINLAGKSYEINKDCHVQVHPDGLRVTLWAVDRDWGGKFLVQKVTIEKNKLGGALVQNEYEINYVMGQTENYSAGYEYDVFYAKCREDARRLPEQVRKAFLGKYDLMNN